MEVMTVTILDDDPMWWWPANGTEAEHEFAERTLDVVQSVARRAARTTYAHPDLALVADDMESWLTDYTFTMRKNIDGGTFCINARIVDQWCGRLYNTLVKASRWYVTNNRSPGMAKGEEWQMVYSSSYDAPAWRSIDDPGAVVGDYGQALWNASEPTDPARRLMVLETVREVIGYLRSYPCHLDWEAAFEELDRLAGDPKPGECAEFGCPYPPVSHKKGAVCLYHYKIDYYENKGTCSKEGCDHPAKARGMCGIHYRRQRVAEAPPCTIEDCEDPQESRGLCSRHRRERLASGEIRRVKTLAGRAQYRHECTAEGCERPRDTKGLCKRHYMQERAKRLAIEGEPERIPCTISGCESPQQARGYCNSHYGKWRRGKLEDPPGESGPPDE